ncbi:MAG TPA: tetratricopeptide repeat protein [Candidatus Kapabacteria bacterium]
MMKENFETALELSQDAKREAEAAVDLRWICLTTVREATIHVELKNYSNAVSIIEEIYSKIGETGAQSVIGSASLVLGKSFRYLLRYEESEKSFDKAIALFRRLGQPRLLSNALILAAELYIDTENFTQADSLLREALTLSSELDDPYGLNSYYFVRSNYYRQQSNFEAAFENIEKHYELKQKIITEENEQRATLFRIEREVEKKEQELDVQRLKVDQFERDLSHTTLQLLAQTELLSELRNDLLKFIRKFPMPDGAAKELRERLKTLPCRSVDWERFDTQFKAAHPEFTKRCLKAVPNLRRWKCGYARSCE